MSMVIADVEWNLTRGKNVGKEQRKRSNLQSVELLIRGFVLTKDASSFSVWNALVLAFASLNFQAEV